MSDNNLIKDNYFCFKHLLVNKNENKAFYLGYRLQSTKTEYLILKILINSQDSPVSADKIAALISEKMTKENVRYHISRTNRKAKCISNRVLIKNFAKNGYFLYEEI